MYISPSPLDMASLAGCLNWLQGSSVTVPPNHSNNANLQACITAASIFFLRRTGRGPRNWQLTSENPFNQPVDYTETYDGNLSQRLFLRNFPINSVASVAIGNYTVPQSTGGGPGYITDDTGTCILINGSGYAYNSRGGTGGFGGSGYAGRGQARPFAAPPQSIQVQYNAGFNAQVVEDDLETILNGWQADTAITAGDQISDGIWIQIAQNSGTTGATRPPFSAQAGACTPDGAGDTAVNWLNSGTPGVPYVITIQADTNVLSDQGVLYFSDGTALQRVTIQPAEGQYFLIAPGQYLFNSADGGKQVLLSYTLAGTPADIVLAIFQLVALNYQRRNWIGIRSQAMKDVGSTTYSMDMDKSIKDVITNYRRAAYNS